LESRVQSIAEGVVGVEAASTARCDR